MDNTLAIRRRGHSTGQPVTDTHLSSEELAAYLDARVSRSDSTRIVSHLATCDPCFKELLEVLRLIKDHQERA